MAEYYISYEDFEKLLDNAIEECRDKDFLIEHKAEILSALTGNYENSNKNLAKEMISLWENQIESPSQLLLGARYIRVQQVMLDFLRVSLKSGLIYAIIMFVSQNNISGFTVSIGAEIVFALWDLFNKTKRLDDWDFCVYMQAVKHYRDHEEFDMKDLESWFPNEESPICNIHDNKWDCDYLDIETGHCNIINLHKLDKAVESLIDKGLLATKKEEHTYVFRFRR